MCRMCKKLERKYDDILRQLVDKSKFHQHQWEQAQRDFMELYNKLEDIALHVHLPAREWVKVNNVLKRAFYESPLYKPPGKGE